MDQVYPDVWFIARLNALDFMHCMHAFGNLSEKMYICKLTGSNDR
jgi:hypothetical protein